MVDDGLDEVQCILDLKDIEDTGCADHLYETWFVPALLHEINDICQPAVLGPIDSIVSVSAH